MGIHSRTATASAGISDIHSLINADDSVILNLENIENYLEHFFKNSNKNNDFKYSWMEDYVFNFSNIYVTKYRYGNIGTSKAPDHPIRFATGMYSGGLTKDNSMVRPSHRLCGLLYISVHRLSDLVKRRNEKSLIDINHSTYRKESFLNQHEVNFFGKIDYYSIVYPRIPKMQNYDQEYHKEIWGIEKMIKYFLNSNQVKFF